MDEKDRRRYFIVGSVILEIVQPLLRTRLENDYQSKGIGSLQAFLNTLPVIHILFHLRHRNAFCCKDNLNCRNNSKLPLIYCQWDLLYTENPGQSGHNCHCKFIANPVQLNELDITLASLILLNSCHLGPSNENAVRELRRFKNAYLSHNTEGKITETEYKSLWKDLTYFVLQLDPNKQDEITRIEKRPLDEGLCSRYSTYLLNIHKKLNEMGTQIQGISSGMQIMGPQIQGFSSGMQMMGPQIQGIASGMQMMCPRIQGMASGLEELLRYHRNEAICQYCQKKLTEQDKLAVSTDSGLVIVDYQKGEIVQNNQVNYKPREINSSADRIGYCNLIHHENKLHWYSLTNDNTHTLTLPSIPRLMTTLQDGSLYVLCADRSVQHVSSDGKHFKTLKTNQSQAFSDCDVIRYNSKQKQMVTLNIFTGIVKILHEV